VLVVIVPGILVSYSDGMTCDGVGGFAIMARKAAAVDLQQMPDLARLAREVQRTRTPVMLRDGDENVAMLGPAPTRRRAFGKRIRPEDIAATLSVFGAWKEKVDAEEFKRRVQEGREDDRRSVRR
jgi:hypothetical protein